MLDVAAHHQLTKMVTVVAEKVCESTDPIVQHRWLSCGRHFSRLLFNVTSKDYEPYMGTARCVFFANVSSTEVIVENKDGVSMKCQRNPERILYALQQSVSLISSVTY